VSDLYEQDFIGWTEQQARLLRQAAAAGNDLGLDWANLIEEIESLGRSYHLAAAGHLRRIMANLLKLEYSTSGESRRRWDEGLWEARAELERMLDYDPDLRSRLSRLATHGWPRAFKLAMGAFQSSGESAAAAKAPERADSPYSQDQILGDWLPERPDPS
jgi:hypothetical protein